MLRIFQRFNHTHSTSANSTLAYLARTTINPIDFELKSPSHFVPKSLLVLSTPNNLAQVIEDSIKLHQQQNLQLVVAGIDTVVPYSFRNGVSELWINQPIKIGTSKLLPDTNNTQQKPKESDGLNVVGVPNKNWTKISSNLMIKLRNDMNLNLNLANTVFSTGKLSTLFYFQQQQPNQEEKLNSNLGQHLSDLQIELPRGVVSRHSHVAVQDKWTDLYPEQNESFRITNCVGNLLKSINNNPAAKYLEDNESLMSIGSKDTEVYVKVKKPQSNIVERFKVIAGGGGWGAKADIIALSPEAKLEKGSEIKFFMVTPEDRFLQSLHNKLDVENFTNSFTFNNSYEQIRYGDKQSEQEEEQRQKIYENLFGCGCENGFFFNGIKHNSPGETVIIKTKKSI